MADGRRELEEILRLPPEVREKGKILADSDRLAVLSYALVYACMHFDALCRLMARQERREPLLDALSRTAGANGDGPAVLHVDFGCGPGTAAWAVMHVLPDDARVTTVGHDHNPHMVKLARAMTADVARDCGRAPLAGASMTTARTSSSTSQRSPSTSGTPSL